MHTSRLFTVPTPDTLTDLTHWRLKRLLTDKSWQTETYQSVTSVHDILQSWRAATQQFVCTYKQCQFSLYTLYDTPLGYMSSISKRELSLLLLSTLSPDIKVRLRYAHGNIIACILKSDIEPSKLLSNRTGVLVSTDTNDVLQTRIGGFTRPNNFYCRQDLDGLDVKLSSAVKHPDLHCVYIVDEDQMLAYDYPE